jgi:uncharacterized protein (TIGR02265 family)
VTASVIRPGVQLLGELDIEAELRDFPRSYFVKGMFFTRLVEQLGSDWDLLEGQLVNAPRGGRYVSFKDYPQVDYMRISVALARKLHARQSIREAMRRLARDDFEVFASSTFGKVVLAVVGDARSALLKTPYVYTKVTSGYQTIEAVELDADTVRIDFLPHYGAWEYTVGQLEGVVGHYGREPTITVQAFPQRKLCFDVKYRC